MPNLLFLVLANNQFSGTVPESLGNIDYSVDDDAILALCYNNLTGDIPASIYEGRLETWYTIKDFIVPQNEGYGFNPGYPVIENAFINLSETSATIPSDGESVITFVIESNTAWRAEIIENDDTEWVGWIEGSSGFGNGTFEFHSNQNNTFAEREIVIEVTGTDCAETATITITQEGGEPYLRAAYDTYYAFDYSANMRELEIYTNCENVTYSCSEDWIIVDQCYKNEYGDICWFTFSVTENQATANREGEIILSGVDAEGNVLASQTISISQYSNGGGVQEYYLNPLDGTIYDLSKSTETCGFEVDTNCNGVTYSCSESWITVEQYTNDEYGRAHYFEFTVTDNETGAEREGAIILSGVDADGNVVVSETVLISQSTTDYGLQDYWFDYEGNPERSISAEATTFYVGISSNIYWECSTSSPSVVVSPSSGNGDGTIKVSVAENTTSEELVHEILFTTEFIERILVIRQAAAELTDPAPDSEQAGQLEDLTRVEL